MTSILQLNPRKGLPFWFVDSEIHFPLGKAREIDLESLSDGYRSLVEEAIKNETLLDLTPRPELSADAIADMVEVSPIEEESIGLDGIPPMAVVIARKILDGSIDSVHRELAAINPLQRIPSKIDIIKACIAVEEQWKNRKSLKEQLREELRTLTAARFSKMCSDIQSLVDTMHTGISDEVEKEVTISPVNLSVTEAREIQEKDSQSS